MLRMALAAFMAIAAFLSSGCGTLTNLFSENPKAYGGVDQDMKFAVTGKVNGVQVVDRGFGSLECALVDLCVTLIGDTLTLPLIPHLPQNRYLGEGPFYTYADSDNGGSEDSPPPGFPLGPPCPIDVNQTTEGQDAAGETVTPPSRRSGGDRLLWYPSLWKGIDSP
jgi:uncharacterized protein YceK